MKKSTIIIIFILILSIKADAQKLSLELSTKKYFLLDEILLTNNDLQYEQYNITSPLGIGLKLYAEPYLYVRSGLAYRQENIVLYNKYVTNLSGIKEINKRQLCHLELPLVIGVTHHFNNLNIFADYGLILVKSIRGKTKDYTGLYNDYSFKETSGKYIDQNLRTGIGVKCSSKISLNLSGEYRSRIWKKVYNEDKVGRYIYNFPSHYKNNFWGLNLSVEYALN